MEEEEEDDEVFPEFSLDVLFFLDDVDVDVVVDVVDEAVVLLLSDFADLDVLLDLLSDFPDPDEDDFPPLPLPLPLPLLVDFPELEFSPPPLLPLLFAMLI